MSKSIESMLWEFIIDNNIATESELQLVTSINGWTEETMNDVIYAKKDFVATSSVRLKVIPAQMILTDIIVLAKRKAMMKKKRKKKRSSICLTRCAHT